MVLNSSMIANTDSHGTESKEILDDLPKSRTARVPYLTSMLAGISHHTLPLHAAQVNDYMYRSQNQEASYQRWEVPGRKMTSKHVEGLFCTLDGWEGRHKGTSAISLINGMEP